MTKTNAERGYHTVTPYLIVEGAKEFLGWAQAALGATQRGDLMEDPRHGVVGHGEMTIGDSVVMFADAMEGFPARQFLLHVYVDDVDAAFAQAKDTGVEVLEEPADQFYGDRTCRFNDKWGNQWYLSTHVEDVSREEMVRRMEEAMGSAPASGSS